MSTITGGQQTTFDLDQDTALLPGALPDGENQTDKIRAHVSEEASAEIPFGRMLKQGTANRGCLLMATATDLLCGISVRSQAYQVDQELGSTGLKPKTVVSVLTKGRIAVTVTDAVTPASPVRVNEVGGTFQTAASAGVTTNISSNARFLTSAGAGEVAILEFDMTGLNTTKVAD